MGGLITKEFPSHMIVEDQLLCQKIFPTPSFSPDLTPFSETLMGEMGRVWSRTRNNWRYNGFDHSSEKNVAAWLNSIGEEFSPVKNIPVL